MCLLVISYGAMDDAPVLVAANREERFDRAALPPHVQPGRPRILCGIDREAGGTWLGVNEHRLIVAVTNRPQTNAPTQPPSRGLLCRALLRFRTAVEAAGHALQELSQRRYAGANYVCLDP
ncbi:MAG: NRDE family protein, partial [Planctomycetota bacterium]